MGVKAVPPVTLLWGEDDYLLREAALALLGDTKATEVDAAEWEGGELQSLATPSLFGEPRALLVNDAKSLRKETLDEIGRYFAAPDPDATLVLACVVAERGKVPAALQKLVESVGEVRKVDIAKKELEPWLVSAGQGATGSTSRSPVRAPSSRRSARNPVSWSLRSANSRTLSRNNASGRARSPGSSAGSASRRRGTSATVHSARTFPERSGRSARSRREGTRRSMVLGGIAARLRDLLKVRSLPDRMPPAQVAKEAGLRFDWQARRYQQQARNFSMAQLVALHDRVTEADRALKSGATGDVVMPTLVTAIAG